MCGILGIVTCGDPDELPGPSALERMRRPLRRRGPDSEGLWQGEGVVLAHHRLAVLDLSEAADQPMATPDGRFRIVYNGELYNDAELRRELTRSAGVRFRTRSDTETVLHAFARHGPEVLSRLRGMFALAIYDTERRELHLARDRFGMKPLYYAATGDELVFASETPAILAHPRISARPHWPMVSAYLTTLQTVLGSATLFEGVYALRPGERAVLSLTEGELKLARFADPAGPADRGGTDLDVAAQRLRVVLGESVRRHLRSDVPVCALLSGGLDSSALCYELREHLSQQLLGTGELRTWCSGGRTNRESSSEDLPHAREVASLLGSRHHEVLIDRERFRTDWPWMVSELGSPLCTPNEVAIHAVCQDLRNQGQVVVLSGEGADELFAGYEHPLRAAIEHSQSPHDDRSGGRLHLDTAAWIPLEAKERLLRPDAWRRAQADEFLLGHYDELFAQCRAEAGAEAPALEAHVRFLRATNLPRMLQRFDTASMLASVEGRTPYCDTEVEALATTLPLGLRLAEREAANGDGGTARCVLETKRVLRRAYRGRLPDRVLDRPKASFPLPFEEWVGDQADRLRQSAFLAELFAPGFGEELAANARGHFALAWPVINLALWADRCLC